MSSAEKSQEGEMVRIKVRRVKEIMELEIPKSVALQHALVYAGNVNRIIVEQDVHPQLFGMLLASTIAIGADLGPFAKGPGAKVLYVSGSGDIEKDKHRLTSIYGSLTNDQQEQFDNSVTMYQHEMEDDVQIDLTTDDGQEVLTMSMSPEIEVLVIDFLPGFFPTETIHLRLRKKVDAWLSQLAKRGVTVVVFDVETPKRVMLGESQAKNTIYLEHDATAPTQFGGGHLIRRSRVDDADSMPKCVSFWYTEIDGKLDYGFAVPDDEDRDAPHLTKRLERQIKVALMREAKMPQKTIAEKLEVHPATICRDFKDIDIKEVKAARAKAKLSETRPSQQG